MWQKYECSILTPESALEGDLSIPKDAKAIVLFAHGSGSGRHSTRNQHVAQTLNDAGFATLLVDLLLRRKKWK
jgi:putative phosphoribosyl transferase